MLILMIFLGAAAVSPLEGDDLFILADNAERTGSYENAARIFMQCAEASTILRPFALSRTALNLASAGKTAEAEMLYLRVLKEYPKGPWVRLTQARLGNLYLTLNLREKAAEYLENALKDLDPFPWFLNTIAWTHAGDAVQLPNLARTGFDFYRKVARDSILIKERAEAAAQLLKSPDQEDRMWGIYALVRADNLQAARAALMQETSSFRAVNAASLSLSSLDALAANFPAEQSRVTTQLAAFCDANGEMLWARVWLMLALREEAINKRTSTAELLADLMLRHFSEGRDAGDACWWLAERYEKSGDSASADRMYRALAENAPEHVRAPRSLYNLANRARAANRTAEAFALYQELGTAHPRGQFTAEGFYRCAQMALKQGDGEREKHFLGLAADAGLGYFYAHRARELLRTKFNTNLNDSRPVLISSSEAFIGTFAPPEIKHPSPVFLLTHLPSYQRIKFFGRNGLEEGEWEALGCLTAGPASLQRLWYIVLAESGFMHTANQFMMARDWGLKDGTPIPERLLVQYPLAYWQEFRQVAAELDLDPYLLLAVARQESTFRAAIVSSAGATGVLQVMPDTARWLAKADDRISADHVANLKSPINSIRLGAVYMQRMLSRSDNNLAYALASYNAGPGNCDKWRKNFLGYSLERFMEAIPFSETNDYVKKVLANYAAYHSLYPEPDKAVPYTKD